MLEFLEMMLARQDRLERELAELKLTIQQLEAGQSDAQQVQVFPVPVPLPARTK